MLVDGVFEGRKSTAEMVVLLSYAGTLRWYGRSLNLIKEVACVVDYNAVGFVVVILGILIGVSVYLDEVLLLCKVAQRTGRSHAL